MEQKWSIIGTFHLYCQKNLALTKLIQNSLKATDLRPHSQALILLYPWQSNIHMVIVCRNRWCVAFETKVINNQERLCPLFCVLCFVFCVLCFVFCVLCFVFCVLCPMSCVLCPNFGRAVQLSLSMSCF